MFWNNFLILCNRQGVAPNTVCADLGLSTATATKWKNGAMPRPSTMSTIAKYFNVSVEYLMGETDNRSPDQPELTEGEKLLLEAYRRASDDVKPVLINVMEALESMPLEKLKAVVSLLN